MGSIGTATRMLTASTLERDRQLIAGSGETMTAGDPPNIDAELFHSPDLAKLNGAQCLNQRTLCGEASGVDQFDAVIDPEIFFKGPIDRDGGIVRLTAFDPLAINVDVHQPIRRSDPQHRPR